MVNRCPGQDGRNLKVSVHKCPTCGNSVEIFSDELRFRCRGCGTYVYRATTPSCIEWCARAADCLGEQRWQQFKAAHNREQAPDSPAKSPEVEVAASDIDKESRNEP